MAIDENISALTDEELDKKITLLQNILYSGNQNLSNQAANIITRYMNEQQARVTKKFDDHLKKNNTDIDNILNIG